MKSEIFRTKFIAAAGLALILLGAACGVGPGRAPIPITATPGPADLHTATARAAPLPLPADAIGPFDFPPGTNPLTGLPVDDPAALARPPLAVKLSNAPDSVRPQAGIGQADLVFEHLVEAGLTRFTALYLTHTPPRVGSVRSARLIDLDLPLMYGALFAYSGASEPIRARLAAAPFAPRLYEGVTVGEPLFFRDETIPAPHNLFVIPAQVWARAAAQGLGTPPARLGGLVFSATPPPAELSAPAPRLILAFGPDTVLWHYAAETGRYARTSDDEPHRDANTGEQVQAANVIVLYAPHRDDTGIVESEWQGITYYSTAIDLLGSGRAVICRDGRRLEGYWQRPHRTAPLSFSADAAGTQPIALKPGSTWIEIVPGGFSGATFAE